MPKTKMMMELGMGTDIRGGDYTKAACRAVHNALHQNSIAIAQVFGVERDAMQVSILIGAQKPEAVHQDEVAAMLPYGTASVTVEHGGMDTPTDDGEGLTVMVNAVLTVYLDLPEGVKFEVVA